jgi:hypothetical protein
MQKVFVIIFPILLWACYTTKSEYYFKSQKSIVLAPDKGHEVVNQYSRDVIDSIDSFWTVTDKDIRLLENNFKKITQLKESYDEIKALDTYAYQYVGVVRGRKKFIYINALHLPYAEYNKDWTEHPIKINDGGDGFWGVLFDIEKQEFSSLSINGSA